MATIPHAIQQQVRAVLAGQGEVPAAKFPDLYAARWGRPLDYRALGYAKLTAAMRDVQGVADVPSHRAPGNRGFVLAAPTRHPRAGTDMVLHHRRPETGGGATGGGASFRACITTPDGASVGLHVERQAAKRLVFHVSVDCSYSMQGERIATACAGLQDLVQSVVGDDDVYAIAGFHTSVAQLHAFMPKRSASKKRGASLDVDLRNLRRICAEGGLTALYDATSAGLECLKAAAGDKRTARALGGARALHDAVFYQVVITDGGDNCGCMELGELASLVASPGLRNYHLIVIGVGELEGRQTRQALECLCAPTHATFQLAPDCAALREQLRWAREQIRATLTMVDPQGYRQEVVATGDSAMDMVQSLVSSFGGMGMLCGSAGGGGGGSGGGGIFARLRCTSCGRHKLGRTCGNCGASDC